MHKTQSLMMCTLLFIGTGCTTEVSNGADLYDQEVSSEIRDSVDTDGNDYIASTGNLIMSSLAVDERLEIVEAFADEYALTPAQFERMARAVEADEPVENVLGEFVSEEQSLGPECYQVGWVCIVQGTPNCMGPDYWFAAWACFFAQGTLIVDCAGVPPCL
ncbi:MAG: hypothetical protein MJE77_01610 [Proteobacteria bacterium]|nr:hypothetical protein [Pseudomonadota bacterium]